MTEVFGKPVEGEVQFYSSNPVAQADSELLRESLDRLFELPQVESVRWEQYTPYFNDGDACEFGIYDAKIKIVGDDEEAGDYEDGYRDLFDFKYYKDEDFIKRIPDVDEVQKRFAETNAQIAGGSHYIFLKSAFGDPAQVTATREGFSIEFYDHD